MAGRKLPTVCCAICKGTGRREIGPEHAATLTFLRRLAREATGAEVSRLQGGARPTAMNNRLAVLERFGLVTSRRQGRQRFFRAD